MKQMKPHQDAISIEIHDTTDSTANNVPNSCHLPCSSQSKKVQKW